MITAVCPQCRQVSAWFFKTRDYNRRLSDEAFDYYRCAACGLIFLSPIPNNLGDYYPDSYHSIPPSLEQLSKIAGGEKFKLEIVQRFISKGRLLEIGPSYGNFAYLAKQAGFDVEAIEMDARCCKFLTDVVGIKVINNSDICEAIRQAETYDIIVLWHVMEHLINPWMILDPIVKRLCPEGIIVIAMPNPASLQFCILQRFWTHVDAPRHVQLIPAELLCKQMQIRGLKSLLLTTTDKGGLGWNIFGWNVSLMNFSRCHFIKILLKIIARIINLILSPVERFGMLGSTYTSVFKKER